MSAFLSRHPLPVRSDGRGLLVAPGSSALLESPPAQDGGEHGASIPAIPPAFRLYDSRFLMVTPMCLLVHFVVISEHAQESNQDETVVHEDPTRLHTHASPLRRKEAKFHPQTDVEGLGPGYTVTVIRTGASNISFGT